MRKMTSDNGSLMYVFDSMTDMMSFVDNTLYEKVRKDIDKNRGGADAFTGKSFKDWADVDAETRKAWDEGIEQVTMSVERLKKENIPDLKSTKREVKFNDAGEGEFDYERMMAGEDPFRTAEREMTGEPCEVTIITDTTTPYTVDSMDILWRGAAAIALTHILEEKGYRVELWVTTQVSSLFVGSGQNVCVSACLKRTSDPLDISTLTNVVSGWYYRSTTFTVKQTIAKLEGEVLNLNYGYCDPPRAAELDLLSRDPHRIYSSGTFSFDAACRQVAAEAKKFALKSGPEKTH